MATIEEIKKLMEEDIKSAFQDVIESEGLVDTGLLRDTIQVVISDDLTVQVFTQDYYKFLDEGTKYIRPYDITEKVLQSPYFQRVEQYYEEAFAIIIENSLNQNT